jgi:hypothetical protein
VLVSAVLRPEQGEDGELEMVRVAAEEISDTTRFPVGQTECAVERLGGDLGQVIQSSRARGGISRLRDTLRFIWRCAATS